MQNTIIIVSHRCVCAKTAFFVKGKGHECVLKRKNKRERGANLECFKQRSKDVGMFSGQTTKIHAPKQYIDASGTGEKIKQDRFSTQSSNQHRLIGPMFALARHIFGRVKGRIIRRYGMVMVTLVMMGIAHDGAAQKMRIPHRAVGHTERRGFLVHDMAHGVPIIPPTSLHRRRRVRVMRPVGTAALLLLLLVKLLLLHEDLLGGHHSVVVVTSRKKIACRCGGAGGAAGRGARLESVVVGGALHVVVAVVVGGLGTGTA